MHRCRKQKDLLTSIYAGLHNQPYVVGLGDTQLAQDNFTGSFKY